MDLPSCNRDFVLQTPRLLLREMTQQDLPDLEEMLLDPAVMYAYEHTFTQQEVREWLERQQQRYLRDGFGLWAVVYRRTGEMVGQAGLTMQDCQGAAVPEVGYLLKRRFWGRGYAREGALACRDYAFEVLGMEQVYSIIKNDNLPSIRVAEAMSMKPVKEFDARYFNGPVRHILYGVSARTFPGIFHFSFCPWAALCCCKKEKKSTVLPAKSGGPSILVF